MEIGGTILESVFEADRNKNKRTLLLNLHLVEFVYQMKSVNHPGAKQLSVELQAEPVQFSTLPTQLAAASVAASAAAVNYCILISLLQY